MATSYLYAVTLFLAENIYYIDVPTGFDDFMCVITQSSPIF